MPHLGKHLLDIHTATHEYEGWLGNYITLLQPDLEFKHQQMRESAFGFLRATFYRWMQCIHKLGKDYEEAPRLLSVGDLHVENFGTWIDAEGRLVWGINDFDEAALLPYSADLIRVACSLKLAIQAGDLKIDLHEGYEALEEGYRKNLADGAGPFVLAERNVWLRKAATGEIRNPVEFWEKMDKMPAAPKASVQSAVHALEQSLPAPKMNYQLKSRRAGLGSLGRVRYVALADYCGGRIAREVKAMAPSGAMWAEKQTGALEILTPSIIRASIRCPDPFISFHGPWQVRRLAPYCTRIELAMLSKERSEAKLLEAMGWETANIHSGTGTQDELKAVRKHLHNQPKKWLRKAADQMCEEIESDFENYQRG